MSDEDPDQDFVSALEALFAAVVAQARSDAVFARRLARAVGDPGRLARAAAGTRDRRSEAPDLDVRALYNTGGAQEARRALGALTRPRLYALVRAQDLAPARASRLNKAQLVEHALAALAPPRAPARRPLDY